MRVLVSSEEITKICKSIGKQITEDFAGKSPVLVCVLKGSAPFCCELAKHIELDLEMDFIQVSSYVGTESTGTLVFKKDLDTNIEGRDVIVVEDIVDTGFTLKGLLEELQKRKPASLKTVTMLDKPSRRKVEIEADYVGKKIDDLFVVGFGLDLDQKYRALKDIYVYNED